MTMTREVRPILTTQTIVERPGPHRSGVWAGFIVSDAVVAAIAGDAAAASRRRIPVAVAAAGETYRSSLTKQSDGWEFIASLEFRRRTGTAIGDTIRVDVALDEGERTVLLPDDVARAIDAAPEGRAKWDRLPYSHRRELMLYVEDARRSDTRVRRIRTVVERVLDNVTAQGTNIPGGDSPV
jgi:hypothetical protein